MDNRTALYRSRGRCAPQCALTSKGPLFPARFKREWARDCGLRCPPGCLQSVRTLGRKAASGMRCMDRYSGLRGDYLKDLCTRESRYWVILQPFARLLPGWHRSGEDELTDDLPRRVRFGACHGVLAWGWTHRTASIS